MDKSASASAGGRRRDARIPMAQDAIANRIVRAAQHALRGGRDDSGALGVLRELMRQDIEQRLRFCRAALPMQFRPAVPDSAAAAALGQRMGVLGRAEDAVLLAALEAAMAALTEQACRPTALSGAPVAAPVVIAAPRDR